MGVETCVPGYFWGETCTTTPTCILSGCTSLGSSDCDSSGWCKIQEVIEEHGGHGPDISGLDNGLIAELTLTPLLQLDFYGGWIVGSVQLDAKAIVTMTPNSPSCSSRRELANQLSTSPALNPSPSIVTFHRDNDAAHVNKSASHVGDSVDDSNDTSRLGQEIDLGKFVQATRPIGRRSLQSNVLVKVEIDAAMYLWGSIDINGGSYFGTIYEAQSSVFTVFSSLSQIGLSAPFEIISPVCISGLIETSSLTSSKPVRADTATKLLLGNRVSQSQPYPPSSSDSNVLFDMCSRTPVF
jgi:hypothetical protein